jgi:hypothetical protein
LGQSALGARHHDQVGEADLALLDSLSARSQAGHRVADRHPIGCLWAGHLAFVPDPIDRRVGSPDVVLIGGGERRSLLGQI